jgi:hypothetical protein
MTCIEQCEYHKMQSEGVLVEEKNPTLAACLGILPGCGSFYTGNYVLGAVDVVTWPVSMLWDPIAGYNEARMINYRASQVNKSKLKQRAIHDLEAQRDSGAITQVEFNQSKRSVETKYGIE